MNTLSSAFNPLEQPGAGWALHPAKIPIATLRDPVIELRLMKPIAVLSEPVVTACKASTPNAEFCEPAPRSLSAPTPNAEFKEPVTAVEEEPDIATAPTAVL
jgi:hypothetical protein